MDWETRSVRQDRLVLVPGLLIRESLPVSRWEIFRATPHSTPRIIFPRLLRCSNASAMLTCQHLYACGAHRMSEALAEDYVGCVDPCLSSSMSLRGTGKGLPSTFSYSMHGTDPDWFPGLAYPPTQHGMAALAFVPQTRQNHRRGLNTVKFTEYNSFGSRNVMAS